MKYKLSVPGSIRPKRAKKEVSGMKAAVICRDDDLRPQLVKFIESRGCVVIMIDDEFEDWILKFVDVIVLGSHYDVRKCLRSGKEVYVHDGDRVRLLPKEAERYEERKRGNLC